MRKIITIVGARPQLVKAAALSRALAARAVFQEVIIHTGQHYDENMSDIFFKQMHIPTPHYNLGIGGGSHGEMTGRQLEKIEALIIKEKPELMVVYGDTNSTLAGALAAVKLQIPIAHVEAGLRSFNRKMPEEINRIVTDHISDILFAPTDKARKNLESEGRPQNSIHIVGDVMYDAAIFYAKLSKMPEKLEGISRDKFILCTIHRAENTDDPSRLRSIFEGLGSIDALVVLPLHPRTRKKLNEFGIPIPRNVYIMEPVGYLEMIWLEQNCKLIVTDSGGVQKEAYFHQKPCITLRDETEWTELVDIGINTLTGASSEKISKALLNSNFDEDLFAQKPYGDGNSATKIAAILEEFR
ncbi:non-hydrolyzing UDP-N-acetylglucosamine 2-epimerase [Variovorax terrae]|uniref:UDP-N-acetylglucosamine 2-epimerase (Non-hydrolyzing) n=1 Tax=Variovorax terrae TaxID=2923278 RepID=A0A9X1VWN7_9BURK|nr:UDP-N-acetylglucosamine 2-epimerase (non-hydrolyzing) [Variovorax terrae]MCJ0764325.1 UDP-N-acetylglucosamine 2-epimerase (non-hydrolyzing) [Variovorax terrae]